MNKTLKWLLLLFFVSLFIDLISNDSSGGYGNALTIFSTTALILYSIFKGVSVWILNPSKIRSFGKAEPLRAQVVNEPSKKDETTSTSVNMGEKKLQFLLEVISCIYWIIFGWVLFSIFQPLSGAGQAQNGMQVVFLLLAALPGSIVLFIVSVYVCVKIFVRKIFVNEEIWGKILRVFLLPIALAFIGGGISIVSEILYSNETFYKLTASSSFEPFIRAAVIVALLLIIKRKKVSRAVSSLKLSLAA